jgi:hypothetical protein
METDRLTADDDIRDLELDQPEEADEPIAGATAPLDQTLTEVRCDKCGTKAKWTGPLTDDMLAETFTRAARGGRQPVRRPRPGLTCACGCGDPVLGRGRFASRSCWARTMNASWSADQKAARAQKGGLARQARIDARPAMSPMTRFL